MAPSCEFEAKNELKYVRNLTFSSQKNDFFLNFSLHRDFPINEIEVTSPHSWWKVVMPYFRPLIFTKMKANLSFYMFLVKWNISTYYVHRCYFKYSEVPKTGHVRILNDLSEHRTSPDLEWSTSVRCQIIKWSGIWLIWKL